MKRMVSFLFIFFISCAHNLGEEAKTKEEGCLKEIPPAYLKFEVFKEEEKLKTTNSGTDLVEQSETTPTSLIDIIPSYFPRLIFQSKNKLIISDYEYQNCSAKDFKSFISFNENDNTVIIIKYQHYFDKNNHAKCACPHVVETTYEDDERDLSKIKYVQDEDGRKKLLKK